MVYFDTNNPNLDKFRRALEWKMLVCFKTIWNLLRSFGTPMYILWTFGLASRHLVYFSRFGKFEANKSGNPGPSKVYLIIEPTSQIRNASANSD
jgi:hypothetical protein